MSKRIDGLVLAMSPICNWKQELERLFSNILTKEEMRELLSFALCSPTGKNKFSNCFFSALQCYLIWMTVALSFYVNGVYFIQIVHFSMSYKPTWKTKRLKLSSESLSVFCLRCSPLYKLNCFLNFIFSELLRRSEIYRFRGKFSHSTEIGLAEGKLWTFTSPMINMRN